MTRIAVLGDSHCDEPDELSQAVLDAAQGCDLIVHLGDINTSAVLDRLETVAPVVAVGSSADPTDDRRINGTTHRITTDGVEVAVVRSLGDDFAPEGCALVLHGGTHDHDVRVRRGVLYVNPGSTRYASRRPTMAVVNVDDAGIAAEIVHV